MNYSSVLQIPAFRNLWLGQTISQFGDAFYYVAFMFMVKKVTGDDQMVGLVGAAETLPYFLLSLYAGVVADRIDRKKILFWSDAGCAILLALFALLLVQTNGKPPVWGLVLIPFLLSTMRAFFMPAKNAVLPNLVPEEKLPLANALSGLTQSIAPMISLAFSGAVLGILYDKSPRNFFLLTVLLNALSFFVSTYYITRLPSMIPDRSAAIDRRPWADLKEGLRYINSRRILKVILLLQGVLTLSISPFFVVYIAANDAWFGGKPGSIAWFECAFFVGLLASTIYIGNLNLRRPGQGFIWGLGAVGLFVVFMAFSQNFWFFVLWQIPCGLAIPFAELPMTTWKQVSIPDDLRGRFFSVNSMLQSGLMPIGLVLGATMVKSVGLVWMFILMGVGMILASLSGLLDKEFRELEIPDPAASASEA